MPSSVYTSLNRTTKEIRLLTLHQDLHPIDNRLQCTLSVASLYDHPAYEALSYVWGPPCSGNYKIWLNDRLVVVKRNLLLALKVLYTGPWRQTENSHARSGSIWIDALCINQEDVWERGHQVDIMGDIYRSSREVLAWLGLGDQIEVDGANLDTTDHIIKSVSQGVFWLIRRHKEIKDAQDERDLKDLEVVEDEAFKISKLRPHIEVYSKPERERLNRKLYKHILTVMQAEYWDRLWIIQEICLAPKLQLLHGVDSVSWLAFCSILDDTIRDASISNHKQYKRLQGFRRIMNSTSSPVNKMDTTLLNLLGLSRMSLCEDPRDKLYGILGVASDLVEGDIQVNYKASLFSLFVNVVSSFTWRIHMVAGTRDLHSYELVKLCQALQHSLLGPGYAGVLYEQMETDRREYARHTREEMGPRADPFQLSGICKGQIIGIGASVGVILPALNLQSTRSTQIYTMETQWTAALDRVREFDHSCFASFLGEDSDIITELAEDQEPQGVSPITSHQKSSTTSTSTESLPTNREDAIRRRLSATTPLSSVSGQNEVCIELNRGITMFITSQNEVGIAPIGTRVGDLLWEYSLEFWTPPITAIVRQSPSIKRISHHLLGRALMEKEISSITAPVSSIKQQGLTADREAKDGERTKEGTMDSGLASLEVKKNIRIYIDFPVLQVLTCPLRSENRGVV